MKYKLDIASNNGKNYTGIKINCWTILGLARSTGAPKYQYFWTCRCDCGNVCEIDKQNILYGLSKGCRKCTGSRHHGSDSSSWKGFGSISSSFFTQLKNGAKVRDIEVKITIEDVNSLWTQSAKTCALTGLPISLGIDASLDRIDSGGSYSMGNIQWVHKDIQLMKNKLSQTRFIELCRLVSNHSI